MRLSIAIRVAITLQWFLFPNPAEAFGGFATRAGRGVLWTWVGGPSAPSTGTYGTKGTPSTSNIPPKRAFGCAARAPNGMVYLFGGDQSPGGSAWHNDVWQLNPTTMEWTWLHGTNGTVTSGTAPTYGSKGTPNAANTPSSRKELGCWTDSSSNFWIFGGLTAGSFSRSDLWRFNTSTFEWTWMAGPNSTNQTATYGVRGVEATGNVPSSRERYSYWNTLSDEFWFFGGMDRSAGAEPRNDLWRYKVSTGMWTWVSGTNTTSDGGTYGAKGTPSSSHVPSGRRGNPGAVDPSGNFWIFGGQESGSDRLSDLWKYNPTTNEWTWMSGTSAINVAGVHGTRLVHNGNNHPYPKSSANVVAGSRGDIFVLFGLDSVGAKNAVMSFNPVSLMWTWISGSNGSGAAAVHGTININSWSNDPGARYGAFTWTDVDGTIWVFGGYDGTTTYNDLWKGQVY